MDKFIRQLLLEFSKVILPGFGAITIADEDTGELMFQEHLNYDDGKLAELLVQESNMDIQEAKNNIAKFVRELQYHIDKGNTYSIYQLGEFSKNEKDEYLFTGNLKTGIRKEETKEPEIITKIKENIAKEEATSIEGTLTGLVDEINDRKEENTPLSGSLTGVVDSIHDKSEDVKESIQEKIEEVKEEVKETKEKVVSTVNDGPKRNIYIEKGAKQPETESVKESSDQKKILHAINKEEKKWNRKPIFWVLIILLFISIGGGIFAAFNKEKVEEYFGWNQFSHIENDANEDSHAEEVVAIVPENSNEEINNEEPEDTEEIIEDEKIEDTNVEPIVEDAIETPSTSNDVIDSNKKYHLIVGTFGELANAEKLVVALKEKGLNAKIIGQYSGMHYVSGDNFVSQQEAQQNMNRIKEIAGGAWIFKSK